MDKYAKRSKEHKQSLHDSLLTEEFKKCTFSPQLESRSPQPRSFVMFLKSQENFLKKKKEDILPRKKVEQTPAINDKSAALASKRNGNKPFHERLYTRPSVKKSKSETKALVKPRRQQKKLGDREVRKTRTNDYILAEGFRKEFAKVINSLGLKSQSDIRYDDLKRILKEINFINNPYFRVAQDELSVLVNRLWNVMKTPDECRVSTSKLELYIATILKIPQRKDNLTSKEQHDIQETFKPFYLNRKASKRNKVHECKAKEQSFRPSLCQESRKLAENYYNSIREKLEPKCSFNQDASDVADSCQGSYCCL